MEQSSSPSVVHVQRVGSVAVVCIHNPPVNAISVGVRRSLLAAVEQADADPGVHALLLIGTGSGFIAGADVREFGQPRVPPALRTLCDRIENCNKPVIAAIHGPALGGGLEIALAAHYRLAMHGAQLGFPEVTLGLMPGAGGTQRAPRLIGAAAALDLMLSGRPIDAQRALELGLVDRVVDAGEILANGLRYTEALLKGNAGVRRTRDAAALADRAVAQAAIDTARQKVARNSRGLFSPMRIVESVQHALDQPFEQGLQRELEAALACVDSPQRAGLIHAFLAERLASKPPLDARSAAARTVASVGVIGGGTMGSGITIALLQQGMRVRLVERDEATAEGARKAITTYLDSQTSKGKLTEQAREAALQALTINTGLTVLQDVDLVIEAVFEDLELKRSIFAELDGIVQAGAILATNTSCLDVDAIAQATSRPQDVIGLHFFSPAHVMKLLEVVVGARTAPDVVATAFALARRLGKVPVRSGVCDGFIGNRMLVVYRQAVDQLVEDGASPYRIDEVLREFGYPMGPFEVSDLAGGDIGWATRRRQAATRDPRARYVEIPDRLYERGWLGRKTGRGWYRYAQGAHKGEPDDEVLALIDDERRKAGAIARDIDDEEILRRYIAAMVNEGANVLHEAIALRPSDIDVVFVNGYGFPRHRGGPMKYADAVGVERVLADVREFARADPLFWKPSPLLEALVARGENFASLNRAD